MSCNCPKPERASGWTPVPEFTKPTEVLAGENIDCYARRAGNPTGLHDDATLAPFSTDGATIKGKITNSSIVADGLGQVSEVMEVSPSDPAEPTPLTWSATGLPAGLSINSSTGAITGTITAGQEGQTFKVTVTVTNAASQVIDSREYTIVPPKSTGDDSLSLIYPYKAKDGSVPLVKSPFGIRSDPFTLKQKMHNGLDFVAAQAPAKGQGTIVAAADGEVIFAGINGAYGNLIKINHFDSKGKILAETRYAHCKQLLVSVGQKVAAGQSIALEGSTGASTGPHLHFECRLGGTQPTDPLPFMRDTAILKKPDSITGAVGATTSVVNGKLGTAPAKAVQPSNKNELPAITPELVTARTAPDCPAEPPNQAPATSPGNPEPATIPPPLNPSPEYPSVMSEIDRAIADHNAANPTKQLGAEDIKYLKFVAQIESGNDPAAKNPSSSATGLYQMLDKTASRYYSQIGSVPNLENRTDPYLATRAQALFYVNEQKKYWQEFQTSGGTQIAGKPLSPALQAKYASLTQGEFCYGLVHHDGVGNAVRGNDLQGLDYYRRKVRQTGFA
jgi:murein DD-endopeptidase MepM/ murein hydrolase activator NlpD